MSNVWTGLAKRNKWGKDNASTYLGAGRGNIPWKLSFKVFFYKKRRWGQWPEKYLGAVSAFLTTQNTQILKFHRSDKTNKTFSCFAKLYLLLLLINEHNCSLMDFKIDIKTYDTFQPNENYYPMKHPNFDYALRKPFHMIQDCLRIIIGICTGRTGTLDMSPFVPSVWKITTPGWVNAC